MGRETTPPLPYLHSHHPSIWIVGCKLHSGCSTSSSDLEAISGEEIYVYYSIGTCSNIISHMCITSLPLVLTNFGFGLMRRMPSTGSRQEVN